MSYAIPSAAAFKARFPAFAAVDDAQIDRALALANQNAADGRWDDLNRTEAVMLYAAHVLTIDGFGTGAEAEAAAAGASGFRSIRSGALSLERFDAAGGSGGIPPSELASTSYGKRYLALAKLQIGTGARAITG